MPAIDVNKLYEMAGPKAPDLGEELYRLNCFLRNNFEIDEFLSDENIDLKNRQSVLAEVCADFSTLGKEFAGLLLAEGLWRHIHAIIARLLTLIEEKNPVRYAELRSAFPLDKPELTQIVRKFGKDVRYRIVEDERLLGGFTLKFHNGQHLDASVRGELEKMKMEISA